MMWDWSYNTVESLPQCEFLGKLSAHGVSHPLIFCLGAIFHHLRMEDSASDLLKLKHFISQFLV